jgi:hypothetical protein
MRATTGARAIVARATGMRDTTRIAAQSRFCAWVLWDQKLAYRCFQDLRSATLSLSASHPQAAK